MTPVQTLNGNIFGTPGNIRRERLKFRNSDERLKGRNRVFRERAAPRPEFKGREENPPLRTKSVLGRGKPLIIIDVEGFAKKVSNKKPPRPTYDSNIQLMSDDIIGDQSYYLSEEFDEPNYKRENIRHIMKGRTEQLGEYYGNLRRNRPNKASNRNYRRDHFNGDHSNYDTHDDRIDSFQRSSEPSLDIPIDTQFGIYKDSPIQVNRDTRLKTKTFDGQGSWIVELDSGKYRINKDSITKLDYMHIDKRNIYQGDSKEQKEFHYKDVDYMDSVTLVIARGQEDDKKRPTNSKELNNNQKNTDKKSDHRKPTSKQGNGSDRRSRISSKHRSHQDSPRQAQSTSRIAIPSYRNNRPWKEKLPNARYPTQDIERMSPMAPSATDDIENPTLVVGEQNFHSLEEWTGSVSPTDKSLFESPKRTKTAPLTYFCPQRSDFSKEQNLSRWATLNRSKRHSANFSPGWKAAVPYPSALKPRPTDYRRISKS